MNHTLSLDITVAIPTYNGAKRLPEILDRLRNQAGAENIFWEIIVIDNNSADNTKNIIEEYQLDWPYSFPLKYFFEIKRGTTFARQKAVREARGELIGFLDDDNMPAPDWVQQIYLFGKTHPAAGAYTGQIHGVFEIKPPDNLPPFLGINESGSKPFLYDLKKRVLPPAAGLVVRKKAWLNNVPTILLISGPIGHIRICGEDMEVLAYIQMAGWEIWYNPKMQIDHKIPCARLKKDYLISNARGLGIGRYCVFRIRLNIFLKPFAFLIYTANYLYKTLIHLSKNRNNLKSNLRSECELELLKSSLLSPFYIWRIQFKHFIKLLLNTFGGNAKQ